MNIAEAKSQVKNAMTAYFARDEFGNYKIPVEKQRPVLLLGPPGIGKTAIMEQIASEMGVGLVSYSMTHHTRQSALGLPYIKEEEFEGHEYSVTEYTMSEIIAKMYSLMRETGVREGILFLDEINCVSETLSPAMLQFLQYKVFGQHRIPKGWIVVTAGNPPEYNKSVRDFDIVTLDRLKRMDIEPDYEVWRRYALSKGVHPSILTYLAARKKDFYKVESTVDGKNFVTPRGWEDLSEMIRLYEETGIKVDETLIVQYLQDPRIAKDFAIYYDLFRKYRSDYKIESILAGNPEENIVLRAQRAKSDERLSFLGLLFDAVTGELRKVCEKEDMLDLLTPLLRKVHEEMGEGVEEPAAVLEQHIEEETDNLEKGRLASSVSESRQRCIQMMLAELNDYKAELIHAGLAEGGEEAFDLIRKKFGASVSELRSAADIGREMLENAFSFCEKAFEEGEEILIFVTELTVNYYTARFIGHYGCDKYYLHNKELQFAERQKEIQSRVDKINWEL
ncbi:MAG: MoxR family ATPase [Eubacteriales bacterium]|nr:MoxR family ATPase [Eubacteriales bacterium]